MPASGRQTRRSQIQTHALIESPRRETRRHDEHPEFLTSIALTGPKASRSCDRLLDIAAVRWSVGHNRISFLPKNIRRPRTPRRSAYPWRFEGRLLTIRHPNT